MRIFADFLDMTFITYSWWVFLWFLIYYFTPYLKVNPAPSLVAGLTTNILVIFIMISNMIPIEKLLPLFIVITINKGIPLFLLRNTPITMKDLYANIGFLFAYIIYTYITMIIHKKTLSSLIKNVNDFLEGKNELMLINTIKGFLA